MFSLEKQNISNLTSVFQLRTNSKQGQKLVNEIPKSGNHWVVGQLATSAPSIIAVGRRSRPAKQLNCKQTSGAAGGLPVFTQLEGLKLAGLSPQIPYLTFR